MSCISWINLSLSVKSAVTFDLSKVSSFTLATPDKFVNLSTISFLVVLSISFGPSPFPISNIEFNIPFDNTEGLFLKSKIGVPCLRRNGYMQAGLFDI